MSLMKRDPKSPPVWYGNLPVINRYTYGVAGERFFRALKDEGRILGSVCHECNFIYVPGRIFCERCLGELEEWLDVGTQGEVHTFTLLFSDYDGSPLEQPKLVALIRMGDGGLVHLLGEAEPEDVYIGMEVEAVFKPEEERQGSIQDISYFKPV